MNDRDERGSDVLADEHAQDSEIDGDELGGGLGNQSDDEAEGASDG